MPKSYGQTGEEDRIMIRVAENLIEDTPLNVDLETRRRHAEQLARRLTIVYEDYLWAHEENP